jgi:hypothetical protein
MYEEIIVPKSARQSIAIPKDLINKKVKVIFEEVISTHKARRKKSVRRGWIKQLRALHNDGDDALLIPEEIDLHDTDWEW